MYNKCEFMLVIFVKVVRLVYRHMLLNRCLMVSFSTGLKPSYSLQGRSSRPTRGEKQSHEGSKVTVQLEIQC